MEELFNRGNIHQYKYIGWNAKWYILKSRSAIPPLVFRVSENFRFYHMSLSRELSHYNFSGRPRLSCRRIRWSNYHSNQLCPISHTPLFLGTWHCVTTWLLHWRQKLINPQEGLLHIISGNHSQCILYILYVCRWISSIWSHSHIHKVLHDWLKKNRMINHGAVIQNIIYRPLRHWIPTWT